MRIAKLFLWLVIVICSAGCFNTNESIITGNKVLTSDTFNLSTFTKLASNGNFDVIIAQGTQSKIVIEGDENIVKLVEVNVSGNTLHVGMMSSNIKIRSKKNIQLYIITPQLIEIDNKGVLNVNCADDLLIVPSISINNKGVLTGLLNLQTNKIAVNSQGAGEFSLKGTTMDLSITTKGAGSISADSLPAQNVNIDLSGAGNVAVNALESLDVTIKGVGNVTYKGSPSNIKKNIKGVGTLENIQ